MNQQELSTLLNKYLDGKATEEEAQILTQYYNSQQANREWNEAELGSRSEMEEKLLRHLQNAIRSDEEAVVKPFFTSTRILVAAAVLVIAVGGFFWLINTNSSTKTSRKDQYVFAKDISSYKQTTLVLNNGREINIETAAAGLIAVQGTAAISKQGNTIQVKSRKSPAGEEYQPAAFTKLITARGKQCEVRLADGSRVWLNAASALTFPAFFGNAERRVEVAGEAYFTVTKDVRKPFRVYTAVTPDHQTGALIEVTGTQFNVNAYSDESLLRTTLLEGRVAIAPFSESAVVTKQKTVLAPGEQAALQTANKNGRVITVQPVDVEDAIAWRQNKFRFHNADLQTIMRQLARWYDMDVVYEGAVPVRNFSGTINRSESLANVLKILEQSNIQFRVERNKIIVRS